MSDVWNEGYFTDVGYTYGYYREVSPAFQRFCLLIKGFDIPEPRRGTHCELGFGQGVSFNIHAASNPGHFVGTDFNPSHAAHASALSSKSGSDALILDDSFEQMLQRKDMPQFDSISLHGIWTWVSRENHKAITEFARRFLKPGGVLYNSYNCFPGWSPAYPLRQLFAMYNELAATPGNAAKRVDSALNFTKELLEANPIYSVAAPGLENRLKDIMKRDRHYIAHEYFNREWNCMYFTDVVDALAPAKLEYAASASPMEFVDAMNLKLEGMEFLKKIEQPILREQARDYFVNQRFRKDLFVRGSASLKPYEHIYKLMDTSFVLMQPVSEISLKAKGSLGEAELANDLYTGVLEALTSKIYRPKTLREISNEFSTLPFSNLLQAMIVLVGKGSVMPCQSEEALKTCKKTSLALNLELCDRSRFGSTIGALSSPLTGCGVAVDRISQLFILAKHKNQPETTRFVWEILKANNEVMLKNGNKLDGDEANLAEITDRLNAFKEKLPIYKALYLL